MVSKNLLALAAAIFILCGLPAIGQAQKQSSRTATPQIIEIPDKRSDAIGEAKRETEDDSVDDDDADDGEEGEDGEDDADAEADDAAARLLPGEQAGLPPMPSRAPIPSLRSPRIAPEPLGPPPLPESWSQPEIAAAKAECKRLLPEGAYELKALEPIKEGVCGAPAPIALKFFNHTPRVELRPAATMTCGLGEAVDRWLKEVVQPLAKSLLHANVIRIANLSAYQCRSPLITTPCSVSAITPSPTLWTSRNS
ncbi:MAG: extensin family protein [Rhodomicrobium sp.]|nr:extensin family protein [Rhodomicrobium sp.]